MAARPFVLTRCKLCGAEDAGTLKSGREWFATHLDVNHEGASTRIVQNRTRYATFVEAFEQFVAQRAAA